MTTSLRPQTTARKRQRALKGALTIEEVMTRAPHTVGSEQPLSTAHRMMREHGIRHLPVLSGGKLVGVLSQRDLYFVESIAGVDTAIDVIADAMTADVFTVGPEQTLRDVVHTMTEHKYGSAVVVDHGKVVGIFTATDALDLLEDALA